MDANSITPASAPKRPQWQRVFSRPSTRLGWEAVALAAVFAVLFVVNAAVLMPTPDVLARERAFRIAYGVAMLACGLTAGLLALVAVIRRHERSWLVGFTLIFGLMLLALILGEFLIPH
ncbi:MAG: hypothetical protein K1X65_14205 [Caldilineales bacterium]|nr:hypothetical protein [Caldilineales bacterium]